MSEENQERVVNPDALQSTIGNLATIKTDIETLLHEVNTMPFGSAGYMQSSGQHADITCNINTYLACGLLGFAGVVNATGTFINDVIDCFTETDEDLA